MADSRQRRQRLSAMSLVLLLASSGAELSVSPTVCHFFFFRFVSFFSAYSSFSDFFVIVAALGSRSPISAFSLPPRMRPMICLSGPSVLYCAFCSASFSLLLHSLFFHSYITFVCLAACFVSLSAAAAIAIFWFRAFPAFGICFNCFPVLLLVIELFACMHPSPWSLWDMFQGWGWERSLNICTIFGSWHLHVGSQRRVLCISFVHPQAKVFKWFPYNLCRLQLRQPMLRGGIIVPSTDPILSTTNG